MATEMTCSELIRNPELAGRLYPAAYSDLHSTGRRVISGWLERAHFLRDQSDEHFEAFIYVWIAFNGWAACVSGLDQDRQWIEAVSLDENMRRRFAELTGSENSPLRSVAHEFSKMWPIFKAQELRRRHLFDRPDEPRPETIRRYIKSGVTAFEPRCWARHTDASESVPLDWPHTLAALYRVRNNLFHGEKSAHIENDKRIVSVSYRLLMLFLRQGNFIS